MGTVPVPYTWSNGEIPDFRDMNERLSDVMNFVMNPPFIRLRRTTTLSVANNTAVNMPWDFVEVETVNMWDATDPTKIKPSYPGYYIGSFGFSFAGNATGAREGTAYKNNDGVGISRVDGEGYTNTGATTVARGAYFIEAFNGTTDYVVMGMFQNSGGALSIQVNTQESQPDFSLRWFASL